MRKRLVAIYSVLVVAIVLLAVVVPGCEPTGRGYIAVAAKLCGVDWAGALTYKLTGGNLTITDTAVPYTFNVDPGIWTCEYVSGGPPDAFLVGITPSATQEVSADDITTFILEFELNQDAWIELAPLPWTVNGIPVEPFYEDYIAEVAPCNCIDVHFHQGVDGCPEYLAAVNETSYLHIIAENLASQIFVSNNWCALNKTPEPPNKISQTTTINGQPVTPETPPYLLPSGEWVTLDVETVWDLEKCLNYTKSINWLGISTIGQFEQYGPHPCVLFELVLPGPGVYTFTLTAWAEVVLTDAEDINTTNDETVHTSLMLIVNVPP